MSLQEMTCHVLLNSMSTAWERGDVGFEWRQRKCAVERNLCILILQTLCACKLCVLVGEWDGQQGDAGGIKYKGQKVPERPILFTPIPIICMFY